jgi:nitrogen fixation protein NifZ
MRPRWELGDSVRVIRNVRNDGTYPGMDTGAPLIRRGSVGHVIDVGTFLQDQIIYSVHFLDQGRIVGCREEELIGAEEEWIPSRYEFREKVVLTVDLPLGEDTVVPAGAVGEIIKVLRQDRERVAYHVHFDCLPGRVLQLPEGLLAPQAPSIGVVAAA